MNSYKQIQDISNFCGSKSFYLFDSRKFTENFCNLKSCFQTYYSNVELGFSFKTNYVPYIVQIAKKLGAKAEVVSYFEYLISKEIGFEGEDIIFNGPIKRKGELLVALEEGALINVDSYKEFNLVEDLLTENNFVARLGIRCNFSIIDREESRFGVPVDGSEFTQLCNKIKENPSINFEGFHCHFSTSTRSIASFEDRARKLIEIAKKSGLKFNFLDIGGGFFGNISEELKSRFDFSPPSYQDYGKSIGSIFKDEFPDEDIKLIIEPGIAVIADTIKFFTEVFSIKKIKNKNIVIADGSYQNIRPMGNGKPLPFNVIKKKDSQLLHNVEITGYTCMEFDCLGVIEEIAVEEEDYIVFENIGAYSIVLKAPFIKGNFPIVAEGEDDEYIIIKEKEKVKDLISTYTL